MMSTLLDYIDFTDPLVIALFVGIAGLTQASRIWSIRREYLGDDKKYIELFLGVVLVIVVAVVVVL